MQSNIPPELTMARTINISEEFALNVLELIDDRAEALWDQAGDAYARGRDDTGSEYEAIAQEWDADANMIRRALGIEN